MGRIAWCLMCMAIVLTVHCGSQTVQGTHGTDRDVGAPADVPRDRALAPPNDGSPDDDVPASSDATEHFDDTPGPSGRSCDEGIPVAANSTTRVEPPATRGPSGAYITAENIYAGMFPARWFRVTVPPRTRVTARGDVRPEPYPYQMFGFTRCAASGVVTRDGLEGNDRVIVLTWPNVSDSPRTFYFVLWTSHPPTSDVPLRVTTAPIAQNGYCATPRPVEDGTVLPDQDLQRAGDYVGRCEPPSPALYMTPALYYRAHVDTGETLFATVHAPASPRLELATSIDLRETCGDGACLAEGTQSVDPGHASAAVWTNAGAPRDVLATLLNQVALDLLAPTLTFRLMPSPSNGRCDAAEPLLLGTTHEANLASATLSALPCAGPVMRRSVWYNATVPANATLEVTASAVEGVRDSISAMVLDRCMSPTCLTQAMGDAYDTARVTWTNPNAHEATVYVVVAGANTNGHARYVAQITARTHP